MIIEKSNLPKDSLKNEVTIVTGAGRGIGFESAKALCYLGAKVIIAEINEQNGKAAENIINKQFGADCTFFVKTDIGNEKDVNKLAEFVRKK